jgi:hypothetical protein
MAADGIDVNDVASWRIVPTDNSSNNAARTAPRLQLLVFKMPLLLLLLFIALSGVLPLQYSPAGAASLAITESPRTNPTFRRPDGEEG